MIISTFELLVKPQLPKDLPGFIPNNVQQKIERLRRTVIQGYFLTIANLGSVDIFLTLTFTVKLPPGISIDDLVTFFDTTGSDMGEDMPGKLEPIKGFTNKFIASVTLMSQSTGLFLVQPNIIRKPELLDDANFEVRGFAEVSLATLTSSVSDVAVLITPEHRGTFFDNLTGTGSAGRDQISYSLPVQNGGLFTFKPST
ncbi:MULTISPECIES: hypothetical protein [unclassified Microcoleus]|uniref:hypothetical protein n=1 Tax=unclassified Microcoleus TaxID=2642155 RepID=UPI002FD6F6D3